MKKIIITITSVILAVIMTFASSAALMGDTDLNGKITAADARAVLRYCAKLDSLTRSQLLVSDIDSDSKVTAADARIILRISAKLESIDDYTADKGDGKNDDGSDISAPDTDENKTKLSPREIYNLAKGYTLSVKSKTKDGKTAAAGTGFYINKNGYIATNYHVIKDAYSVTVTDSDLNDINVLRVVAYSKTKDIAIISVDKSNTPFPTFSASYLTGDTVYTLGSPLGLELTFTSGMISQSDRRFYELNDGISYIQTTAPITYGNSGSPLIDEYGNVIGICSMTYQSAQNMNFAIPANEIFSLDMSNPITLPAFYQRVNSDADSDTFGGILLPGADSVTLTKGGTYALYVIGIASGEYSVEYSLSNSDFSVIRGSVYGNVSMFYITANKTESSGELRLWFDRSSDKVKTVSLRSAPSAASHVYCGIKGNVPDFGALCSVAPTYAADSTSDNKNIYAFYYDTELLSQSGQNSEMAISGYIELLQNNGFSQTSSDNDKIKYSFENSATKTNVCIAEESTDSKTYICILINY